MPACLYVKTSVLFSCFAAGSHPGSSEPQQSSAPGRGGRAAFTPESVGGALVSRVAGRRRSKG